MTTQIQITYKQKHDEQTQEIELMRFKSESAAMTFLSSIQKNPDVQSAKKV